jgi:Pectate lyase superfamily protein
MNKLIVLSTVFVSALLMACSSQITQANNPDLGAGSDSTMASGVDTLENMGSTSSRNAPFNVQVAAPAAPRIPNRSVNVKDFGAIPNDGKDDTKAIQKAIDALEVSGGSVLFAPGRFDVLIQRNGPRLLALKLHSKLRLAALDSIKGSSIRLANAQGNYESIMATADFPVPLEDFVLQNLRIDANGENNPVKPKSATDFSDTNDFANSLPRHALRVFLGARIQVNHCAFSGSITPNTITLNGGNQDLVRDAEILNSSFKVGGGAVDFDHSTIYTTGPRMRIIGNTFSSQNGPGTRGARTAIEIHGDDQTVIGNRISGFSAGINVTGYASHSRRQVYARNRIDGANIGFLIWSGYDLASSADKQAGVPMLEDVLIDGNDVKISSDDWIKSGLVSLDGGSSGVALWPNNDAKIRGLRITNNRIEFVRASTKTYQHDHLSNGVTLWNYEIANLELNAVTINGNRIINAPGAGIWATAFVVGESQNSISNNLIENPARSLELRYPEAEAARSGIAVGALTESKQNMTVQTKNLLIEGNTIRVTAKPDIAFGVNVASSCLGNCVVGANKLFASNAAASKLGIGWTTR